MGDRKSLEDATIETVVGVVPGPVFRSAEFEQSVSQQDNVDFVSRNRRF